tara:strand:- start:121 stop:303 length:183 start_codon:yes stop_codon:yes gene_type:complete
MSKSKKEEIEELNRWKNKTKQNLPIEENLRSNHYEDNKRKLFSSKNIKDLIKSIRKDDIP